ncbi:hypothetical protein [Nocardioides sp. AX2bis]|uniref:hypothetical protein n=1 Tax=Nocardioides sp. AX2bis TaxID=2653157 RepID=UPI001358758F|nr:hypothetical protein [Nocardioides sp. AX2bis]
MSTPGAAPSGTRVYRMAPPLVARLVGSAFVGVALLLFATTALVYAFGLNGDLLVVPLLLGVVGAFALGWWLRSRAWVLRFDDAGYAVRLVRGARVTDAAWSEVREVVTTTTGGHPCLVLRLGDGRETVIPVEAVAGDREELVREVRARLQRRG